MMTFSVPLVTIPLFLLFSTNVFTDMTTATWNPASDLLMIKLLVEYPAQKDSIMNWTLLVQKTLFSKSSDKEQNTRSV